MKQNGIPAWLAVGVALILGGCGDSGGEPASPEATDAPTFPTLSINAPTIAKPERESGPAKGTPEWHLLQIKQVRVQPYPKLDDEAKMQAARLKRQEEIVDLANQVIVLTHTQTDKQPVFDEAVGHLMEARLQLALQGGKEESDELYKDATALYQRNPQSVAAAEACFALARYAHAQARELGKKEPRWLKEFAVQARFFAGNYPQQEQRALPLLYSAAWSCELYRMTDEARTCYELLSDKYPQTPQGRQAQAVLRRLDLSGQTAELAGPAIGGDYVSLQDFKGKPVLVVFWSSDNTAFNESLPQLTSLIGKYAPAGLQVLGVNLDLEETDARQFLQRTQFPGRHIFHAERDKRRWDSPVVKYYGIRDIPTFWLVDRDGRVVEQQIPLDQLDTVLQARLKN